VVKIGMYSYFGDEDIEVKDWKGLKLFFEEWDKYQKEINENKKLYYATSKKMIKKNEDGKEYFTFEGWNDLKLISYWYDEQRIFFTLIAPYIEGSVDWEFESKDESGRIEFEDGKCNITTGQMDYQEWEAKENFNLDKLNPQLKKLMILGNLK